ncbi:MAG: YHS domain-containing protein [Planctomycetes bacterium]|nr:YHS domain-containing protein [Planctomycetota bacterium]
MTLKIGVMGGATGRMTKRHLDVAHRVGQAIARNECILITGACPGLPLAAACGAKQEGGFVVGISPGLSLDEHIFKYQSPTEFHDVLIYTGSGLMGREVVNIRSSDMVVIIGGRSGTLGELAIAYDEGKLIGVLTGTGGISDLVADILRACKKETGSKVVYDADPEKLIKTLLRVYRAEHYQRPSCFCAERPPGFCAQHPSGETGDGEPELAVDPVCGMKIAPQAAAAKRKRSGQTFVFCSPACVKQFDADPSKYAGKEKSHV